MIKVAAAKSTRVAATATEGKILYAENDANVMTVQSKAFAQAGYIVERAQGRAAAVLALRSGHYDAVVLGHTLTKDDRHHLPYMAKKANRDVAVLVLHASGKHPAVDYAIDSRQGDDAVLDALKSVIEQKALAEVS